MKKIKIFLFSSIFVIASLVVVGFYTFSPNISYGINDVELCVVGDTRPECSNPTPLPPAPDQNGCLPGSEYDVSTNSCRTAIGTLTYKNCTIDPGKSDCEAKLTWKVTNVVTGSSNIGLVYNKSILFKGFPTWVGDGNNIVDKLSSVKGGTSTNFSLKYIDKEIATIAITPTCADGSAWDGTKCLGATLSSFSYTNCSIPEGSTACDVTITWNVSNTIDYVSALTVSGNSIPIKWGNSTSITYTLQKDEVKTFYLYYLGKELGSKTISPAYGSFSKVFSSGCIIPDWGTASAPDISQINNFNDTCKPRLTWSTNNSFSTPAITATINNVKTTITSGISGFSFEDSTYELSHGDNRSYYLYHNSTQLDSVNITSICNPLKNVWNGTNCVPAELTVENCTIPINGTSCSLDWKLNSISDDTGPRLWEGAITTDYPSFPKNHVLTIFAEWASNYNPIGAYVSSYGNTKFFVNYGGTIIDEVSASATCAANSGWDGTKCSPATFTVTPTSCAIGLNQSGCAVEINFSLKVNTTIENDGVNWVATSNDITSITTSTNIDVLPWLDTGSIYMDATRKGKSFSVVPYGNTQFYLYNNFGSGYTVTGSHLMGTASATATCGISNYRQLVWSGGACVLPAPLISATNCVILEGQKGCNTTIEWNITGATNTNTSFVKTLVSGVLTDIFTGNTGSKSYYITNNNNDNYKIDKLFYLYYNGSEIDRTTNPTATCNTGLVFDPATYTCIKAATGDIFLINNCSIPLNASTCTAQVGWTTANLNSYYLDANIQVVKSSGPNSSGGTLGTGKNVPSLNVSSGYGSNTFWLKSDSFSSPDNHYFYPKFWDEVSFTTSCVLGSYWVPYDDWHPGTCKARPAPVVTMGVIKTSDQTVIPTETNWFSKIVDGVTSQINGNRTKSALVPETPVTIEWAVLDENSFDKSTVKCFANGVEQIVGKMSGSFDVTPSSTTKYSVTCSD